ncbi:MAG: hypothetical protein AAF664_02080 [Planctomycetota bacterium]
MQQIKLFKFVDTEIDEMERQINRWMRKSGAKILSVGGNLSSQPAPTGLGGVSSFAGSDILVILHYEVPKEAGA